MAGWLARQKERPWVAHLLRAVERFGARLGAQFAAAVTYFSVLALVPTAMVAFSVVGFVLTTVRPDVLPAVIDGVSANLGGGIDPGTRLKLLEVVRGALSNYTAIGLVGLLSALYSGQGWMGNLKNAVRAQWRPAFDLQEAPANLVKKTLVNLATLLGLIGAIAVTFGLAALSTNLADSVVGWLGLSRLGWLDPVLRIVPIALSIGAGWLLFMYLYTVLPETREPWPVVRRGALIGAVGLVGLQYLASFLIGLFSGNAAAAIFGPVIVIMLFFDLFAQLVLFVAAWIATARHEAVELPEEQVRFALSPAGGVDAPERQPATVPQDVAARSLRLGIGAGYATGAATGLGVGAGLAYLAGAAARRLSGRRRRGRPAGRSRSAAR